MRRAFILGGTLVAGLALALVACDGDDTVDPQPTTTTATGGTAGMGPGGGGGAGGAGGSSSCVAQWSDGTMEPDPDGPDTQIHGTSAFDGNQVWMAWNRPDGGSLFDLWLAAYACDGSLAIGPIEVTQADDNELDPALAVSGDRLLVVWMSDNGVGIDNMDIRYRVFTLDGTPVTDAVELAASRNGTPVTGNTMAPSVAAVDGGWRLAGSWGHADAPGFQAFSVELDLDGVVQGDADDAELDAAVGQTATAIAADDSGVYLAWQADDPNSMTPTARAKTLGGMPTLLGDPAGRPHVAPGPWHVWDTDGDDIVVQPPGGAPTPLNFAGTVHNAQLAIVNGDVSVLWMEIVTGIRNRVHVAPLSADGTPGAITSLASQDVPSVYPLDLTMIDSSHAVVVYQDGTSPDFRLKADWLTLSR